MTQQKYELVLSKRVSSERPGCLHAPRRVVLIWDGETGVPAAMQVSHRATAEDVLSELETAGIKARGLENGSFEPGKLTQRFAILPGSTQGVVLLVPWEKELGQKIKILSLRDDDAVVRVVEGVDDATLRQAGKSLFGREVQAISQDGDGAGRTLIIGVDARCPGVLNVREVRLKSVL